MADGVLVGVLDTENTPRGRAYSCFARCTLSGHWPHVVGMTYSDGEDKHTFPPSRKIWSGRGFSHSVVSKKIAHAAKYD